MTRKKTEKQEDSKAKDRFAEAREKRKLAHEAKTTKSNSGEDKAREEFRKFFIKIKSKLGLEKSMEQVIWTHFKAAGFDKKDKFEDGIKHFGYTL